MHMNSKRSLRTRSGSWRNRRERVWNKPTSKLSDVNARRRALASRLLLDFLSKGTAHAACACGTSSGRAPAPPTISWAKGRQDKEHAIPATAQTATTGIDISKNSLQIVGLSMIAAPMGFARSGRAARWRHGSATCHRA
jgi:hypothetical protein